MSIRRMAQPAIEQHCQSHGLTEQALSAEACLQEDWTRHLLLAIVDEATGSPSTDTLPPQLKQATTF